MTDTALSQDDEWTVLERLARAATPGEYEYVPSNEHHGPYVCAEFGPTLADFYFMTEPSKPAVCNGGPSKPVHFLHEMADANAAFLAACSPDTITRLIAAARGHSAAPPKATPASITTEAGERDAV